MDKRTIQIALDIFVIILFIAGAVYIYTNWDWLHNANDDPCKVCMDKTGGVCIDKPIPVKSNDTSLKLQPDYSWLNQSIVANKSQ